MEPGRNLMDVSEPHTPGKAAACRKHGSPKQVGDGWVCCRCGKKVCGAKLRNKQARCRNDRPMPNGRCRLHGGATPEGMASPNWKHGGRSKHRWLADLPGDQVRLGDRFNAALDDPNLTVLRHAIALNDSMITSYLASLKVKGKALTYVMQKRVHELLDVQRKLVGDEARRQRDLSVMVTQAQFAAFTNQVLQAVFDSVADVKVRLDIQRRVQAALLTSGPANDNGEREGGDDGED